MPVVDASGQVNLIIADEINPHLTAEEYMDKDEYENELKQVLGDTRAAFDISERDTLIFGEHGLLVGGPSCRLYEGLLCTYVEVSDVYVHQCVICCVADCRLRAVRRNGLVRKEFLQQALCYQR